MDILGDDYVRSCGLADSLGVTTKQLRDPTRPTIRSTEFFGSNVCHLYSQIKGKALRVRRPKAVRPPRILSFANGLSSPNHYEILAMSRFFGVCPKDLLMVNLSSRRLLEVIDDKGRPLWRVDVEGSLASETS
jgi:hypothetical protein